MSLHATKLTEPIDILFLDADKSGYPDYLKKLMPLVESINQQEIEYQKLTDEQLRAKTSEFRQRIQAGESTDDLLVEAFAAIAAVSTLPATPGSHKYCSPS